MPSTLSPKAKLEIIELIDKRIYEKHVTREDFTELKGIVRDLVQAQKRTEEEMRFGFKSLTDQISALGSKV